MTHDPAIFCRPPVGTPPGTPCWLKNPTNPGYSMWAMFVWAGDDLWDTGMASYGANRVARATWRFHSVATVPGEGE